MSRCFQVTVEKDYIAYGETPEEAVEKVKAFMGKGPNTRVSKAKPAEPIGPQEVIDVAPVLLRKTKSD